MTRNKILYFPAVFLFLTAALHAQPVKKIKFKKNASLIYFFPAGIKTDTLYKNKEALFYLLVPDSLKDLISIQVENGQLLPTANDSLVKFNYLKGFKYESLYVRKETNGFEETGSKAGEFKTLVNGVSTQPANAVNIQFYNKKEVKVVLENKFFYKE